MIRRQIAHRTITYTRPAWFRHPGGKAMLDIYVYDNGDVGLYPDSLYPDSRPATLTREEWAKLVEEVESVELPTSEPVREVIV